ncbi:MAG: TetR/AcrR family transcriptional repressor of nem operon [Planctomycetota bacterium]|jgi:TetR/AcrR family transcriptional repressor of nem operon
MKTSDTTSKLLDSAQLLIQERGYNAFSYKDLAEAVGIRTASIHYHFPMKGDLGLALMRRYTEELKSALVRIESTNRAFKAKIRSFIKLYSDTEARGAICLCGSLASDRETLPVAMQEAVSEYLELGEQWLTEEIKLGMQAGEFRFSGKAYDAATTILSSLQGGLIVSRAKGARPLLASVQRVFLSFLEGGT